LWGVDSLYFIGLCAQETQAKPLLWIFLSFQKGLCEITVARKAALKRKAQTRGAVFCFGG